MTFSPVIPIGGYAGFRFLERTSANQREAHANSPSVQRDLDYFKENIGKIDTAEELVSDFRLLRVSLGAFGLGDDIGSRFFIKKVLEDGTLSTDALSNKLTDKRYGEMAKAFGFDLGTPSTKISTFADDIAAKFTERTFEAAVGNVDENMRLALNAKRELSALAQRDVSDTTRWFTIMGTPPLRTVFERAFNLPSSFASLDLDRQLEVLQDRSESFLGSSDTSQFEDETKIDDLVQRFLIMGDIAQSSPALTSANTALILLGAG